MSECVYAYIGAYTCSGLLCHTALSNDKYFILTFHYQRCDDRIKCFVIIVVSFSSIQVTKQLKLQHLRRRHIRGFLHVFTTELCLSDMIIGQLFVHR